MKNTSYLVNWVEGSIEYDGRGILKGAEINEFLGAVSDRLGFVSATAQINSIRPNEAPFWPDVWFGTSRDFPPEKMVEVLKTLSYATRNSLLVYAQSSETDGGRANFGDRFLRLIWPIFIRPSHNKSEWELANDTIVPGPPFWSPPESPLSSRPYVHGDPTSRSTPVEGPNETPPEKE